MIQFDLAKFKGPKFSLQDLSFDNRLTLPVGKIVPVGFWEVFPNEEFDCKIQQLTRFMPMPAPIMQRFDLFLDAHFVPYRILKAAGFDSEKYFNVRTNSPQEDNYTLPLTSDATGKAILAANIPGTLADYLGLPCPFTAETVALVKASLSSYYDLNETWAFEYFPDYLHNSIIDFVNYDADDSDPFIGVANSLTIGNKTVSVIPFARFVLQYCLGHGSLSAGDVALGVLMDDSIEADWQSILTNNVYNVRNAPATQALLDKAIIDAYGYSMETLREEYFYYVYKLYAAAILPVGDEGDFQLNMLPFWVFHRIIGDWYINSNFEDPDTYIANHLVVNSVSQCIDLPDRYWGQDYFTSCFTSAQAGDAVRIPVDGTIADLRSANAIQKMLERAIYTGKRYIEQVRSFFGAHSSDARFDRTEVLGRQVYRININDVTQVNQGDYDGMLSTPVGQVSSNGISVNGGKLFHYKAEEHGMIMVLASVRPKAAYYQGFNRIYLKRDLEDFLLPQLAQVGEQPVYKSELYWDPTGATPASGSIFGFNRRYSEYMYHPSEVHGEMRGSMDYWHAARKFDSTPALNTEFLTVTENDQVTRVFNVPGESGNVVSWLFFDVKAARALPRYVDYEL